MEEFTLKTKIISGKGAMAGIRQLGAKRLLVVTDPFFRKNGTAEALAKLSGSEAWSFFDEVRPDPDLEQVARGAARIRDWKPDALAAIGGGSAIDCAKAMLFFSGEPIPLAAIPTTSGSGSEVTDFAVLTYDGIKYPLVEESLIPKLAILDSDLLSSLPPGLIADTGFDVLTHSCEAYVAKNAGAITDALAAGSFCRVMARLEGSYRGDIAHRLEIHEASCMAGIAFRQAGLGICHALAHSLGGVFHVPHGRLNAILLPAVIRWNRAGEKKYAELARQAGCGASSDIMALRNLLGELCRLRKQLGLPESLAEAGIDPALLDKNRNRILSAALQDPCCKTSLQQVDFAALNHVLREVRGHG